MKKGKRILMQKEINVFELPDVAEHTVFSFDGR
jgi:hypothetical protein